MHSTDKLIANLTQNDIEAISNRVFKNKVTHSEKKNLAKKKKNKWQRGHMLKFGTAKLIWDFDHPRRKTTTHVYHQILDYTWVQKEASYFVL